jgi:hypothetical protein
MLVAAQASYPESAGVSGTGAKADAISTMFQGFFDRPTEVRAKCLTATPQARYEDVCSDARASSVPGEAIGGPFLPENTFEVISGAKEWP